MYNLLIINTIQFEQKIFPPENFYAQFWEMKEKGNVGRTAFTKALLAWNKQENRREMPWKGERDPYKIWLSEIILQQTRVEQGWAYYERFVSRFPDVVALANAADTDIFKLWEGLGYYSRCKNLIATARFIAGECGGVFPDSYAGLLALKGVGPYTAAAIASFAYHLPHAVVDGNVFRVLSRYFGIHTPIDDHTGKQTFTTLAQSLLPHKQPAAYNQAIMDFGATRCKPRLPDCKTCPLRRECWAFAHQATALLPIKEKKLLRKTRWFDYLLISDGHQTLVRKRPGGDIWENLFEFVLLETEPSPASAPDIRPALKQLFGRTPFQLVQQSGVYQQQLTHQTIHGRFFRINVKEMLILKDYEALPTEKLVKLAFPKFITHYLTDKKLTLNLL